MNILNLICGSIVGGLLIMAGVMMVVDMLRAFAEWRYMRIAIREANRVWQCAIDKALGGMYDR